MKFDDAWTLAGQPRDGTPAPPPGKRTTVLPCPPACRALFRQGKYFLHAMLAVFRTGPDAASILAKTFIWRGPYHG